MGTSPARPSEAMISRSPRGPGRFRRENRRLSLLLIDNHRAVLRRRAKGRQIMIMALLLDLANIVGGFLLAVALVERLPRVGADLGRAAAQVARFGWVVGVVALV